MYVPKKFVVFDPSCVYVAIAVVFESLGLFCFVSSCSLDDVGYLGSNWMTSKVLGWIFPIKYILSICNSKNYKSQQKSPEIDKMQAIMII